MKTYRYLHNMTCLIACLLINASAHADTTNVELHPDELPSVVKSFYPDRKDLDVTKGIIVVSITVDTQGKVEEVEILKSSDPSLEAPIIEAVGQWRFKPGIKNGLACVSKFKLPIRIDL